MLYSDYNNYYLISADPPCFLSNRIARLTSRYSFSVNELLRLQDAPHHQREGRSAKLHDHPCGCRRQGTAEGQGLRERDLRQTGR